MAERYIPEHRRTQFKAKNTFKPDELRRRREEQQVEIRKAKREENLAKRRGIGTGDNRPGASLGAAPDSEDENPPTESQVCCQRPSCNLSLALPSCAPFAIMHLSTATPKALAGDGIVACCLPRALQQHRPCDALPPLTSHESSSEQDLHASAATHLFGPTANACVNTSILRNPASLITTTFPSKPPSNT